MFRARSPFEKTLEKATSHLLLEPDLESTLQIVDAIRQNDVQPKTAVQVIKKKIAVDNPHVAVYALDVLEMCVKNCGAPFHREIATKEFMDFFRQQAKRADPVKEKILHLFQTWAHAFRNAPSYRIIEDNVRLLKMQGFQFPELEEADAMFSTKKGPDMKDGEECILCRVHFSLLQQKHNCRHCGDVFCQKCSSHTSTIPKFGIEREVRVCDLCYNTLKNPDTTIRKETVQTPVTLPEAPTQPTQVQPQTAEEEELQLALAISRSEAESKEKERERLQKLYGIPGGGSSQSSAPGDPSLQPMVLSGMDATDLDPELARYLNRNYWEKKSESTGLAPSAPHVAGPSNTTGKNAESDQRAQDGEQAQADKGQFMAALQSSLEIFVNRMRSNSQRGRPIANDSSVQSLFSVISSMHPQLMKYQQDVEDQRAYFESLQDRLAQLRDAREALDSLREEHREKRRREMEELERQRQIQMMQKLEVMRQKKNELLEMQRQQALQRLQEQEREMAMRQEQQKQLAQMRQMQTFGYPQMYGQQPMPAGPGGMMMGGPGVMPPQNLAPSMGPQGPANMMPGYMPGPQPTDGSQAPQMGGYMGQPMGQQGMDAPSGSGGISGPLQGPQNPAMFMQPGVGQGPYSQGPPTSSSINPPVSGLPGSYQAPGQIPPQAQMQLDGGQPPAVGGVGGGYSGPPPSMGYTSMPPTMDYGSFNMQSLASTLPQQEPPPQQGGQNPPGPQPGQQYPPSSNWSNNQMPAPHHLHSHMYHMPPPPPQQPPTSHPPQHPAQNSPQDAQLISFD